MCLCPHLLPLLHLPACALYLLLPPDPCILPTAPSPALSPDDALLPYVVVGQRVEVDQVERHAFSPLRK